MGDWKGAFLHQQHPSSDLQFSFHPDLPINSVPLTHHRGQLELSRIVLILFPQNLDATPKGKEKRSFSYDTGETHQLYIYFYSARSLFPAKMTIFHLWKLQFPPNKTSR